MRNMSGGSDPKQGKRGAGSAKALSSVQSDRVGSLVSPNSFEGMALLFFSSFLHAHGPQVSCAHTVTLFHPTGYVFGSKKKAIHEPIASTPKLTHNFCIAMRLPVPTDSPLFPWTCRAATRSLHVFLLCAALCCCID